MLRRDPYIAAHNGAPLAKRIAQALAGQQRLVALVGHGTNLANLAALLDTSWELPGQPDSAPPGGTLTFEVWRTPDGRELVRVIFFYQTPDQLRQLQTLGVQHPPGARVVAIPGCKRGGEGVCTLQELSSLLQLAYAQACGTRGTFPTG